MSNRELKYLKNELIVAHRNAKAADTLGRYAEAAWWEERERQLWEDLNEQSNDGKYEDFNINVSG